MPSLYVSSFHPLACNPAGLRACQTHGLPPFIDGSIRREPDFEHPLPAITCLCRAGRFAPRLREGDHVVYLTVKGRYGGFPRHQRLVAVLRVERLFDTHEQAAGWYSGQRMDLPNNLMVSGNRANPLSHSHQSAPCGQARAFHAEWDQSYKRRADANGRVVVCSRLHVFLDWDAPILTRGDLCDIFGHDPGTRNPGRQDLRLLPQMLQLAQVSARPSTP